MDNKYYIKRNFNNQVAKITENNISFFEKNFKIETIETNIEYFISLIRSTNEAQLGDFFQNSRHNKLPLSAICIKKFTLCSLYKAQVLSKTEFNNLQPLQKFEFIISQKTISWVHLLDKFEILGF